MEPAVSIIAVHTDSVTVKTLSVKTVPQDASNAMMQLHATSVTMMEVII
jgi:hypothetical protein